MSEYREVKVGQLWKWNPTGCIYRVTVGFPEEEKIEAEVVESNDYEIGSIRKELTIYAKTNKNWVLVEEAPIQLEKRPFLI